MKITIVGTGYVGLSMAVLLSKYNQVIALDIDLDKVTKINNKVSPIDDKEIIDYLSNTSLNLYATTDQKFAYKDSSFIIVATPTDYNPLINQFDTSSVDKVVGEIAMQNQFATIIIKSTVPVGYTKTLRKKISNEVIFSPEFLREGKALFDNLYPSRIIVGSKSDKAKQFAKLLVQSALKENIDVLFTDSTEAEAIKLFSNTFLAMRIAFFNELDTFAELRELNTKSIIDGVCLDPRIGNHYNNPSFGYGGYCLPKDTRQLLSNFSDIPQKLMTAIVESNYSRIKYIADRVISMKPKCVGVYRLIMKTNSDNFRHSSILEVVKQIQCDDVNIVIFEPSLKDDNYMSIPVIKSFEEFVRLSDVILSNRIDDNLKHIKKTIYSRDVFNRD